MGRVDVWEKKAGGTDQSRVVLVLDETRVDSQLSLTSAEQNEMAP